jgi:hypothetical protein
MRRCRASKHTDRMDIAIRTAALLALEFVVGFSFARLASDGANIGAGIAGFLALLLGSAAWGFVDGRTGIPMSAIVFRWVVIALVIGLLTSLLPQFPWSDGVDATVWRSDLISLTPFIAALVAVPALAAAALSAAIHK